MTGQDFLDSLDAASQRKRIIRYMESHGSITSWEATHHLDIMSPRKRLSEINDATPLRKEVVLDTRTGPGGRRKTRRYIRYSLQ